ncbi:hypothetical protein IGS68_20895 [Skermanella sp. TT6]|uniref:Uncharacterized protein n=1 Tax=Skermanella cutis TaxID=2775420 RepID=A0ABX7B2W2_9PROT|nr:hypothetical protein [Skermanella sp. TT6]QQP88473.1 hypothetical protein IGS68_20895 [Skermanella sp. TT6]
MFPDIEGEAGLGPEIFQRLSRPVGYEIGFRRLDIGWVSQPESIPQHA